VRLRFTRVDQPTAQLDSAVETLVLRFEHREQQEIARMQEVLALVTHAGCQTNALTSHFGEELAGPCGHCSFCLSGRAQVLPQVAAVASIDRLLDRARLRALVREQPQALGEARQQARFLCGLSSPAVSRARLSSNSLFGVLDEHRFGDVLAWCARDQSST
jgi:ATP-dependent DNA helicase RecQ